MVIPVRAGLLMIEAQGVEQLMLDCAVVQATGTTQGHSLTTTRATHIGPATVKERERKERGRARGVKYIIKNK